VESRSEAKKAVIVVTDGKSNIGPPPVRVASELLALRWDDGVTWNAEKYGPQVEIYAFSVADANTVELESIASRLPAHVFRLSTFSLFVEFARSLHGGFTELLLAVLVAQDHCISLFFFIRQVGEVSLSFICSVC